VGAVGRWGWGGGGGGVVCGGGGGVSLLKASGSQLCDLSFHLLMMRADRIDP